MQNDEQMFKSYTKDLLFVENVHMLEKEMEEGLLTRTFTSSNPNSRQVTLSYYKGKTEFLTIEIDGVDCGWWNTVEDLELDLYVDAAKGALRGEVQFGRSPIIRRKEGCFKLSDGTWLCVPTRDVFTGALIRKKPNKSVK